MRCSTKGGRVALTAIRNVWGMPTRAASALTVSVRYTVFPRAGKDTAASVISRWPLVGRRSTLPQRDVHRPVVATRRGELTGAVQGVDDPHPVVLQPDQVVVGLLAEHRIARALGAQPTQDQLVGQAVTGVAQRPRVTEADLVAHFQQQLPRIRGEFGSQCGVGQLVRALAHRFSISDDKAGPRRPATERGGAGSVPASPDRSAARARACAAPRSPSA